MYIKLRKLEDGLICFKNAYNLNPTNGNTLNYYGFCLIVNKDLDKAEEILQKAIKLSDSSGKFAYFYLGHISFIKGNNERALNYYREGFKNYPKLKLSEHFWKSLESHFDYFNDYDIDRDTFLYFMNTISKSNN